MQATFIKIPILLMALLAASLCNGQSKKEDNTQKQTVYYLGDYMINPAAKTVGVYQMLSGHWEGYYPDRNIHYGRTTLYIIGKYIFFKEHCDFFPKLDFKTLRILYRDDQDMLLRDKNYIYENIAGDLHYGKKEKDDDDDDKPFFKRLFPFLWNKYKENEYGVYENKRYPDYSALCTSKYKVVNDFVYSKGKDLYVLEYPASNFRFTKIEGINPDTKTFKHLIYSYFTDKNGLYSIGTHGEWKKENGEDVWHDYSEQIENTDGKQIIPELHRWGFVYGNSVYCYDYTIQKLPLTPDKLTTFELNEYWKRLLVSDCDTAFFFENGNLQLWKKPFPLKNINQWQMIASDQDIITEDDGKTAYFRSCAKDSGIYNIIGSADPVLMKTNQGFLIFDSYKGNVLLKIDKLYFRNIDTKQYEELDPAQYHYIGGGLAVYKNRLYLSDCIPVVFDGKMNLQNLHFITQHNVRTNYLSDGESLVFYDEPASYNIIEEDGKKEYIENLENGTITGVDSSTLKVINENVLIDSNNIYSKGTVIPIKKLGFKVCIIN